MILTRDQYATLLALQAKGISHSDFLNEISSFASENAMGLTTEKVALMYAPGSDVPANDNQYLALNYEDDAANGTPPVLDDFGQNWVSTYRGILQETMTFSIRGNTILVLIPYQYDAAKPRSMSPSDPGGYHISSFSLMAGRQMQLLPVGGCWGEFSQGTTNFLDGEFDTSPGAAPGAWKILAFATASEKRTKIITTTGSFEISGSANLELFQAGGKIGANETIQSAFNIYNQYTMNAQYSVRLKDFSTPPFPIFYGTIRCTDQGILLNCSL